MPSKVYVRETLKVGTPIVFESPSPRTSYMVVFEDDGETGYFYGLDTTRTEQPILDSLHIYNVRNVTDREKPSIKVSLRLRNAKSPAPAVNGHGTPCPYMFASGEPASCRRS